MSDEPRMFTRRSFLAFLGAAAASVAAAPLLARFPLADPEAEVAFSATDMGSLNAILKEVYSPNMVADMVYRENPFLKMIKERQ